MVRAPGAVGMDCTRSYWSGEDCLMTVRVPSPPEDAKAYGVSKAVASTPGPMGKWAMILPLSARLADMTTSSCGLRQPMKRRWLVLSMDMPVGAPPGPVGQVARSFQDLVSMTATWFLSWTLTKTRP